MPLYQGKPMDFHDTKDSLLDCFFLLVFYSIGLSVTIPYTAGLYGYSSHSFGPWPLHVYAEGVGWGLFLVASLLLTPMLVLEPMGRWFSHLWHEGERCEVPNNLLPLTVSVWGVPLGITIDTVERTVVGYDARASFLSGARTVRSGDKVTFRCRRSHWEPSKGDLFSVPVRRREEMFFTFDVVGS